MANRHVTLVRVSSGLRLVVPRLEVVDRELLELEQFGLASKVLDAAMELANVHVKVVQLLGNPPRPARREQPPNCRQLDIPF